MLSFLSRSLKTSTTTTSRSRLETTTLFPLFSPSLSLSLYLGFFILWLFWLNPFVRSGVRQLTHNERREDWCDTSSKTKTQQDIFSTKIKHLIWEKSIKMNLLSGNLHLLRLCTYLPLFYILSTLMTVFWHQYLSVAQII